MIYMLFIKKSINKKGFTLVELLLVLVIIAIILVITIPNILEAIEANRRESGKSVEKLLIKNLELYNKDHESDLWISNNESNGPKCKNISYSELLSSNSDIKLGECLLNSESSLTIIKTDNGKYKYYAGITCGKGLATKGNSNDDKYISKDENENRKKAYYYSESEPCDKEFTLTAVLNGGRYLDNDDDWTIGEGTSNLTKIIASGDKYGLLPELEDKEDNEFKGWNTAADGSGVWITEDDITTSEIDTIYAIWQKTSKSTKLAFEPDTIEVLHSTSTQTRAVTGAHGGIGPYKYKKTDEESDISLSSDGIISIPGNKLVGSYTITVEVEDDRGDKASGVVTISVVDSNNNSRCPTLKGYVGEYDGQSHEIIIKNDGYAGSGWTLQYRTSTTEEWTTTKPTLTDAGTKTVYVKIIPGNSSFNEKDCGSQTITINKKTLESPTKPEDKIYNGKEQTSGVECPEKSSTSGNTSGTDAKTYTQICTLPSGNNYKWDDDTDGPKTIEWRIKPKTINVEWGTSAWIYDGNEHKTTVTALTEIENETMSLNISNNSIKTKGTKNVTASCESVTGSQAKCENYILTNTNNTIRINPRPLTITAKDQSISYGQTISKTTDDITTSGLVSGHSVTAITLAQSTTNVTTTGKITASSATIKDGSSNTVTDNYSISYVQGDLTIGSVPATCPTSFSGYSGTYDGSSHTITATGQSGGTLQYRTSTTGTWSDDKPTRENAGTTTVYVQVLGDSNHSTKDCGSKTITISAKSLTIPSSPSDKTYNGTSQSSGITCPSGSIAGGTQSATNASTTAYTQTCTLSSTTNYKWSDDTTTAKSITWKINKKAVTITAKDQSISYGQTISKTTDDITTSGLVSGHSVTEITLVQSTTGKITASDATIKDESNNTVTDNYNIIYNPGTLTIRSAYTAIIYYNSNLTNGSTTISSTTTECTATSEPTCTATIPTEVIESVGTYNNDYAGLNIAAGADMSPDVANDATTVTLSADTTYYAIYRTNITNYYYDTSYTSRTIYRNQWFTNTTSMADPVLSTTKTGTSNYSTEVGPGSSRWIGLDTGTTVLIEHEYQSPTYNSVAAAAESNATTLYTWYEFNVSYQKGLNVALIGKTSDRCIVTTSDTSCIVNLPKIETNEGYVSVGWSTTNGATTGIAAEQNYSVSSNNTTLYANADCQGLSSSGTYTAGNTITYGGKSYTIVANNTNDVALALNDTVGSSSGNTYNNANTYLNTNFIESDNTLKAAKASGCLVNQGTSSSPAYATSNSGLNSTTLSNEYWVNSGNVNTPQQVNTYTTTQTGLATGFEISTDANNATIVASHNTGVISTKVYDAGSSVSLSNTETSVIYENATYDTWETVSNGTTQTTHVTPRYTRGVNCTGTTGSICEYYALQIYEYLYSTPFTSYYTSRTYTARRFTWKICGGPYDGQETEAIALDSGHRWKFTLGGNSYNQTNAIFAGAVTPVVNNDLVSSDLSSSGNEDCRKRILYGPKNITHNVYYRPYIRVVKK